MMALENVVQPSAAINFAGKSRSFRHDNSEGSKVRSVELDQANLG